MPRRGDINEEAGEQDVSKINAAGLINLRIQDAWNSCTRYYGEGLFDELRDELTALWPEFYADADPKQKKKIKKLDETISYFLILRNSNRGTKKLWFLNDNKYKKSIYNKWLYLKTLEKAQGVGKAYYDSSQDDWE